MPDRPAPPGWLLRVYLGASRAIGLRAWKHLERRRLRGKEDPDRWREKAADRMAERPAGRVVWLHAVGLGEVLALRGLIEAMASARPDLHFLVTSSARASGEVFARNRPPNTIHQFLPLDVPWFRRRFLDHWRPSLSVWAEQDLWPGLVIECDRRAIPLAMINARMNARAYRSRRHARSLYADLYRRFALIGAQDEATAQHIMALAPGVDVRVTGSLKAACSALADSPERTTIQTQLADRWIWCCAPSHAEDEAVALDAAARLRETRPEALLILAPRQPERREAIQAEAKARGLGAVLRSESMVPFWRDSIWIADTFGEMGLWYRLSRAALIGGSFGPVEGHNPWEAVRLGVPVLHGPHVANFAADYAGLTSLGGCRQVNGVDDLLAALADPTLPELAVRAAKVQADAESGMNRTSHDLLAMLER